MLTLRNILTNTMTLSKTGTQILTQEEWDELVALKNAINEYPGTVCPQKMEKFTELLVRSLEGKSDPLPPKNWNSTTFSG
jgi:hypothetical protein